MGGENWRTFVPVHSPSAAAIQQPINAIGNASSLHRRGVHQNRPEVPPPPGSNFSKTKLRSLLESTKVPEKRVKTKLSEAEKLTIARAWSWRTYVDYSQSVRLAESACFRSGRILGFSLFCPIAAVPPEPGPIPKPPAPEPPDLAYSNRPTPSSRMPENQKNIHDRKLQCRMESTT
jgi:hypothetical protein